MINFLERLGWVVKNLLLFPQLSPCQLSKKESIEEQECSGCSLSPTSQFCHHWWIAESIMHRFGQSTVANRVMDRLWCGMMHTQFVPPMGWWPRGCLLWRTVADNATDADTFINLSNGVLRGKKCPQYVLTDDRDLLQSHDMSQLSRTFFDCQDIIGCDDKTVCICHIVGKWPP